MIWRSAWMALMAMSTVSIAFAQSPSSYDRGRFQQFLGRQQGLQQTMAVIGSHSEKLPDHCPTMAFPTRSMKLMIISPPRFEAGDQPTEGVWKEAWAGEGCGRKKIFNIWIVARPGTDPRRIAMLPGTSIADPMLQRDMVLPVSGMAQEITKSSDACHNVIVVDTAFMAFTGPPQATVGGRRAQPWHELWTVDACGQTGAARIDFTPDATGTATSVGTSDQSYALPYEDWQKIPDDRKKTLQSAFLEGHLRACSTGTNCKISKSQLECVKAKNSDDIAAEIDQAVSRKPEVGKQAYGSLFTNVLNALCVSAAP